jgi:uridine kinase
MNSKVEIKINNNIISVDKNTTIRDIVNTYKDIVNYPIVGVKVNNEIVNYNYKVVRPVNVNFFDSNDLNGYKMYQAGLKFVLEVALKNAFGSDVDIEYDHSMARGIHATILNKHDFNKNDTVELKKAMLKIIENNLPFIKLNIESVEASNYYDSIKYYEKSLNIHNITNQIIILYRLDKYINYFYTEMPDTTGVLTKFDLTYINSNEIALMFPTPHTNNSVPAYIHYGKVIDCFKQGKDWLNRIGIPYVSDINNIIENGNVKDLIKTCETNLDNNIHQVALTAINKGIKYLLIAGPSSSGKTTTAKKIALNLRSQGMEPIMISTDDYFLDREYTPMNSDGTPDFEGLNAIDIDGLNKDLNDLVAGKEVKLPSYNFISGHREYSNKTYRLKENGIVVMEGLHTLNDELTKKLDKNLKYKVYLSPFIPVNIDRHNYISTTDLRLLRRIIRDNNNRGYDVAKTIECWQSVRKGEEKNIFPFIDQADEVINTSLAYELGVLKVYVIPLLYSITNSSPYYPEARRLIYFLKAFFPISSEYVSHDSIIREFIGGSSFRNEGDK